MSVLWLPLRAYTFLVPRSARTEVADSPLGEAALLLLLALLHHAPSKDSPARNTLRAAFAHMQVHGATWLDLSIAGCLESHVMRRRQRPDCCEAYASRAHSSSDCCQRSAL